jgi:hypothetical protein
MKRTGIETIASNEELLCYHRLGEYERRAAMGGFSIPSARIFPIKG